MFAPERKTFASARENQLRDLGPARYFTNYFFETGLRIA